MAKKEEVSDEVTPTEKKSVLTTFVLLFPSVIIAMLTTFETSILTCVLAVALFCYQAILIKSFVDDHYALN
jgi:hypothetical protein